MSRQPTDLPPPQPSNDVASKMASDKQASTPEKAMAPADGKSPAVSSKSTPPKSKTVGLVGGIMLVLGVVWASFGVVGFVMALICFGYSGSIGEKLFGLLAAVMMGPFYFIYYFSSGSYCKRMPPTLF
jgi:hypothetical protein